MEEPGSFYICTETSPRCYIIQEIAERQAGQVWQALSGGGGATEGWENGEWLGMSPPPPVPVLPSWWSPEAQRDLDRASLPRPTTTTPPPQSLFDRLRHQLQYYFSRENLAGDSYLRSQMDASHWIPICLVASFPMVRRLSLDLDLIRRALRSCPDVEVDESGEKVRPSLQRNTLLLRDVPAGTREEEIAALFQGTACPNFTSLQLAHNNSWYVRFASDEAARQALVHLRTVVKTLNGAPILVRIKTGTGSPLHSPEWSVGDSEARPLTPAPLHLPIADWDLGYVLHINGYMPQGILRPKMSSAHSRPRQQGFHSPHWHHRPQTPPPDPHPHRHHSEARRSGRNGRWNSRSQRGTPDPAETTPRRRTERRAKTQPEPDPSPPEMPTSTPPPKPETSTQPHPTFQLEANEFPALKDEAAKAGNGDETSKSPTRSGWTMTPSDDDAKDSKTSPPTSITPPRTTSQESPISAPSSYATMAKKLGSSSG